ncbi:CCR4-NOT transcription complex subunit 1, partial [Elysia marginata]
MPGQNFNAEITVLHVNEVSYPTLSSMSLMLVLVNQHKAEADRHLFRCLFSHIDFNGDGKNTGKDAYQIQFLSQEFGFLLNKSNFVSILCYSIDNPLQQQNFNYTYNENHSCSAITHRLWPSDAGRTEGGIEDSILHRLLLHLSSQREQLGISLETLHSFFKTVRELTRSAIVSPFIYPNLEDISGKKLRDLETVKKNMTDINVAEVLLESGYNCTVSVDECRTLLAQCGAREITADAVARTLGMMARTPQGLGSHVSQASDRPDVPGVATWNVDVFLQVVKEMNPHLNWKNVIFNFDHKGFLVSGKKGLRLLVQAFMLSGLQNDTFPIDLMYRPWTHTEGQLSFLANALKHPDVFCLADHKGDLPTVDIDKLKSAPNEDDREIAGWKCLSLVEALLRLADSGPYSLVQELFKAPVAKCPDVLVLALLQSSTEWSGLKQELMTTLIPIFLGQHTNSAVILHYAWHHQGQQSNIRILIMNSMAEWYMRGEPHDQVRLSRILDVAQELKALNMLLKATPYAFVIDLACLASRREYLKLDMWLNDKITQHKEAFIQSCVTFLKRRCPQVMGMPMPEEPLQTRSQLLPPETVITMLNRLKMWMSHLSPDLVETINTMCENATLYLERMRPPQQALNKLWGRPPMEHHPRPQIDPLANIGGVLNQPGPGPVGPAGSGVPGNVPSIPQQSMAGSSVTPGGGGGVSVAPNLPQAMASLTLGPPVAPGSPSKAFPPMSQQQQPGNFNPIMGSMNIGPGPSAPNVVPAPGAPGPRPPVSMAPPLGLNTNTAPKTGMQALGTRPAHGNHDMSNIFPEMTQTFSKEVEDRANAYFEQIYNQPPNPTMSIDEVLAMLKLFKDSHEKSKRDVFACMLRNLFEEYRFFPEYPERELQITAQLFGGIIEQNIVTYWTLGIALRYILEALRKPPNTNMYHFGVASLERFKTRLKEYPQYCQHLAQIPHFNQIPSHLVEYVDYGSRSQEPPHPQMPMGMLNDMTGRPMTPVSNFGSFARPMLGLDNSSQGSSVPPPPPPNAAVAPPSLQVQPPATSAVSTTPAPTNATVRPTFPK